jgi:putative transposase
VTAALQTLAFDVPAAIFHSDQGKQLGAEATRTLLLERGFQLSMSRAGTPTDNGSAERFVGLFKLAVAERCRYQTLGAFLQAAQEWVQFYNTIRPHESLRIVPPSNLLRSVVCLLFLRLPCFNV